MAVLLHDLRDLSQKNQFKSELINYLRYERPWGESSLLQNSAPGTSTSEAGFGRIVNLI